MEGLEEDRLNIRELVFIIYALGMSPCFTAYSMVKLTSSLFLRQAGCNPGTWFERYTDDKMSHAGNVLT